MSEPWRDIVTGETCPSEHCPMCNGEACERHGHDPCDCDVIERHESIRSEQENH